MAVISRILLFTCKLLNKKTKCINTTCSGESLPEKELEDSIKHSEQADVVLVLGTSMRVAPACKLPLMSVANGGKMIIVNLQITPYDKKCAKRSFAKTDEFLTKVLKYLGYDSVDQTFDALAYLKDVNKK